jgi:ABC-type multidrug transport system fused ATPase/permease subunit
VDYIYVMDNGAITEEGTYEVFIVFSTHSRLTQSS